MPMFSGAKKRGVVAPSEQEMVSFLADDKSKTYHRRSVPTRRSKAFSAVRRMIPTTMIPSVGAGKESDVKKRGAASQKDELRVSLIDYDGKPAAAPGDREQKADFATPWSTKHYVVLLIGSFLFTTFFFHRPVKEVVWSKHTKLLQPSETGQKRCYFKRKQEEETCNCGDPTMSEERTGTLKEQWKRHHTEMVSVAKSASANLDVVFLGDSITERFSGTAGMGTVIMDDHKKSFEKRFSKRRGGRLEGKAFGSAGDTGPNLLWHLENGLADSLDPKVWFIMIGTNDLVSKKCTEHMVLANILNVAKKLSEAHPESLFVLHGIMPRKDKPDSKSQFLGQTWKRAQNINSQIRSFCRKYRNLHYMNAGTLMLVSSKVNGRAQLDPSMIEDGLHPTLKGYETWGDYVMNKLVDVLKDFEEFKAKIKEK